MRKFYKFQIGAAIFFSALFVVLGYEIKRIINFGSISETIIVLTLSVVFSTVASNIFSDLLVRWKLFRKKLFKESWIEGYWYNMDLSPSQDKTKEKEPAMTEITFKDPDLGFQTTGYRLREGADIYSFSQYVILVGPHNLYVNFSTSNTLGPFKTFVACGYFFKSPGSDILDMYDGVIMYPDGTECYRQRSKKIDDRVVRKLKKQYGDNWYYEFLTNNKEYLVPSRHSANKTMQPTANAAPD